MKTAFSSYQLGSITLPNRFVMGSMHLGLEGATQTAERLAAFYERRFEGGVGLIVTGGIAVNEAGLGSKSFYNMQDPAHAAELKEANSILAGKGVMCAQLFHAGRYALNRGCVGPSALRAPINRHVPHALTEEECWQTIADFGTAAEIAIDSGFGAVEIMGSEGYLINQFFSGVTNQRDDFFGGDHKRRMNMSLEVLKEVKSKVPEDFPVIFRMSGIDLIPGNPTFEEVVELATMLKEGGVTALNIGIGWHESRVPTISQLVPRGAWAKIAKRIKVAVPGVPIIASNRVNSPDTIDAIFENGEADIISMARPFLADPFILNKIQNKKPEFVNTCIACNQACLDHGYFEEVASCIVNPEAVNELAYSKRPLPTEKNNVVVVGSGPGGMEAARAAASLGHKVTLLEKAPRIGGQLNLAAEIPGKFEFKETIRYFENELPSLGVDIQVNTNVTVELLASLRPDSVIFATGVKPRTVDIPGMEKIPHADYVDYLTGKFRPGKNVAVIGGGGIGVDVAHKLTDDKEATIESYFDRYNIESYTNAVIKEEKAPRKVAVFKRTGKPGAGLGPTTFWALRQELFAHGVEFVHGLNYDSVTESALVIKRKNGRTENKACDSIIVCAGQVAERSLADAFIAKFPDVQSIVVGGALNASKVDAKRAFFEGADAAYKVGQTEKVAAQA